MAGKAANVPLLAQDSDSEEEDEEIAIGHAAVAAVRLRCFNFFCDWVVGG